MCAPLDCLLPPQDLLTLRGLLAAVPEIVEVDLQHPAEHPKNLISKIKEIDKSDLLHHLSMPVTVHVKTLTHRLSQSTIVSP